MNTQNAISADLHHLPRAEGHQRATRLLEQLGSSTVIEPANPSYAEGDACWQGAIGRTRPGDEVTAGSNRHGSGEEHANGSWTATRRAHQLRGTPP